MRRARGYNRPGTISRAPVGGPTGAAPPADPIFAGDPGRRAFPDGFAPLVLLVPPPDEPAVTAFAPASLSNLGPGFDALGLAIRDPDGRLGDRIDGWRTDTPGVTLEIETGDAALPTDPGRNTAGRAAQSVLERAKATHGVRLRLHKGIPLGSGMGGSAASAVAGAWAANALLDAPFAKDDLLEAVLEGEAVAAGARHGDNVLPSLQGGLILVSPSAPTDYRRLALPPLPPLVVVLPHVRVLTRDARALLPGSVSLADASAQAADLALLLHALQNGDVQAAGRYLMRDRLAEPFRARLVPPYTAIRDAALGAGAAGCALSGSGPALVALLASPQDGDHVLAAMLAASRSEGMDCDGWIVEIDTEGARLLDV